jgi:hypothetical protein
VGVQAPIGGQLTPSDETSDVRWACANKLADITTEVFATRLLDGVAYTGPPALRFHDREHLLELRGILRTRTFGAALVSSARCRFRRHADCAPGR